MMLVGTDSGLFMTNDGVNYSGIPAEAGTSEGSSSVVTSIYTHGFDTLVGMGGNLYILVQDASGSYAMHKVNVHNFGGDIHDVMYIPAAKTLLVATANGLFRLDGVDSLPALQTTTSDNFYVVVERDMSGLVERFGNFCLMTAKTGESDSVEDVVVASDGGVLSAFRDQDALIGYKKAFGGTGVYFLDNTPGGEVVGTDEGVYNSAGSALIETGYPVRDYCTVGADRFYFVDSKVISA